MTREDPRFTFHRFPYECGATQSYRQNTASIEVFYLSKLAQIVSVGPGICPQKGQRDDFTGPVNHHVYNREI